MKLRYRHPQPGLTGDDFASTLPAGCDQQGRYPTRDHVIGQSWPQPAEAATDVGADPWLSDLGDEMLFWVCVIAGLCCFAAVIWFGPMGRTL